MKSSFWNIIWIGRVYMYFSCVHTSICTHNLKVGSISLNCLFFQVFPHMWPAYATVTEFLMANHWFNVLFKWRSYMPSIWTLTPSIIPIAVQMEQKIYLLCNTYQFIYVLHQSEYYSGFERNQKVPKKFRIAN